MATVVSAVLIVKNEREMLRKCLESLSGVDEIIVLDTGSTDGTMDLAKSLGARVFRGAIRDPFHFADARNEALNHAHGEWVVSIDADETVCEGSIWALREAISETKSDAWKVQLLDRGFTFWRMSVFRRGRWLWKYRVHERLGLVGSEWSIGDLPEFKIQHHSRGKGSRIRNLKLLRLCIEETPEHSFALLKLGQELFLKEEWNESIEWFEKYVQVKDLDYSGRTDALSWIGRAYAKKGDLGRALKSFERAAALSPELREPLWFGALELIRAAEVHEARTWLKKCLAIAPSDEPAEFGLKLPAVWGTLPDEALTWCDDQIEKAEKAWNSGEKPTL